MGVVDRFHSVLFGTYLIILIFQSPDPNHDGSLKSWVLSIGVAFVLLETIGIGIGDLLNVSISYLH